MFTNYDVNPINLAYSNNIELYNPESFNSFDYVNSNPLNMIDPWGNAAIIADTDAGRWEVFQNISRSGHATFAIIKHEESKWFGAEGMSNGHSHVESKYSTHAYHHYGAEKYFNNKLMFSGEGIFFKDTVHNLTRSFDSENVRFDMKTLTNSLFYEVYGFGRTHKNNKNNKTYQPHYYIQDATYTYDEKDSIMIQALDSQLTMFSSANSWNQEMGEKYRLIPRWNLKNNCRTTSEFLMRLYRGIDKDNDPLSEELKIKTELSEFMNTKRDGWANGNDSLNDGYIPGYDSKSNPSGVQNLPRHY